MLDIHLKHSWRRTRKGGCKGKLKRPIDTHILLLHSAPYIENNTIRENGNAKWVSHIRWMRKNSAHFGPTQRLRDFNIFLWSLIQTWKQIQSVIVITTAKKEKSIRPLLFLSLLISFHLLLDWILSGPISLCFMWLIIGALSVLGIF